MKKLLFLFALALWPLTAHADPKGYGLTVETCGNQSYKIGFDGPVTVDTTGVLCTTSGGGGGGGGTSSAYGAVFPAAGTAIGVKANSGGTMTNLTADASGDLNINVNAALPAGTNVIGHAIIDSGSTTVVSSITGAVTLPTGASTSANQTSGGQKTQIVDGSGNVIASTSNNLNVQCANCSGSGASATDAASFTATVSLFAPTGGFYQTTATSNPLTNGQQGMQQFTAQRAGFINLRNSSGTEIGVAATPVQVSLANTGANATAVLINQPTAASLNATVVGTGTFATQSVVTAASGAFASGSIASGALASGAISDGADVTLGAKADAKSTATDTTAITAMQVLKEISAMEQAPATRAVTNAGTFATQSAITAASGSIASGAIASGALASGAISDGADVTLGAKADAKSTATDTTSITIMQVLKEISAMEQAPATRAVTNAGTFAVQAAQSGNWTDRIVGNAGGVLDAAGANQTAPANELITGCLYQASPAAVTSTNVTQTQCDSHGSTRGVIMDAAGNARGANVDASNRLSVTVDAVSASNISTNVAQINGVTPLMGNGTTGTGSPRVTISSDNSAVAGLGVAAAGAAPPANAVYIGGKGSSNLTGMTMCDSSTTYDASTNGKTTLVAGVSAKKIYICGFLIGTGGTATNVSLGDGTGSNCVTTYTAITPAFQLAANDKAGMNSPFWNGLVTLTNADNLCVSTSAGNAVQVQVFYTIQ